MAVDIRPACASDVDALMAIENAVFQTDRLSRRSIRRLIGSKSAAVCLAEVGGRVAGYCIVLFRAGASAARLYSVAAAPGFAGQGVGRSLVATAVSETARRGRRSLSLEVRQDNVRAIEMYRRAGFRPTGSKAGYYQDGMTALRMQLQLAENAGPTAVRNDEETFAVARSLSPTNKKAPRRAAS